jgi:hypothetical protein
VSKFDYEQSKEIVMDDPSFAALIMAAIRKADTQNAIILSATFPAIHSELVQRYNSPGGRLPGES